MLTSPLASNVARSNSRTGRSSRHAPKVGVLMLHGLGGSPAELYPLTAELKQQGYVVQTPLVPGLGMGTDLGSHLTWQDWDEAAQQQFDELARLCDVVHVCGFCGGALLACLIAARQQSALGDLILISPTFRGDGWAVPRSLQLFRVVTMRWLARLFTFHEREPFGLKDERIRAVVIRMLNSTHRPEERIFDISGIKMMEFNKLASATAKRLRDVTARTLIVHPREDDVSSLANAEKVARGIAGRVELRVLPDCYHVVLLDRSRAIAVSAITAFLAGGNATADAHAPGNVLKADTA